jgi:alpha-glucosidase
VYVRKESDGSYIYEVKNQTIKTGDCNSGIQNVYNNITTSSGPHKRSADVGAMILDRAAILIDELAKRDGPILGLPGQNLIDPPYHINNTAGSLSNLSIDTDLIHANGLAEYDTHNMYSTMMSAASRGSLLDRQPNARPLV